MENMSGSNQGGVASAANMELDKQKRLSDMTVLKRNGTLVPFRRDRIVSAIESAMRETHNIAFNVPLSADLYSQLQEVSDYVLADCYQGAKNGSSLTVEGIQDIVEVKLMECGHHDVARDYIVYRDDHKKLREDSPRNIKVQRRDGKKSVRFNPMKISRAIEKCFRATRRIEDQTPSEVIQSVNILTNNIVNRVIDMNKSGEEVHIELIQDEVEKQMMAQGYYNEAKNFIIYRADRAENREERKEEVAKEVVTKEEAPKLKAKETREVTQEYKVVEKNGTESVVTDIQISDRIEYACRGLENVDAAEIIAGTIGNFYQGIKREEVDQAATMATRAKVEKEPNYSYVTARLLLDEIYRETFEVEANDSNVKQAHKEYFKKYIATGIENKRLTPDLESFDLDTIADSMDLDRDLGFTYLGLQTIYDRYLVHQDGRRIETPQIFWMRVCMGLSLREDNPTKRAIEFYDILSQFLYVSSTPTLFNSGTCHSQMSSCYLSTVDDNLSDIFKLISDDAQLSKWAGGLGNDWSNIRATGATIKGTNGKSQGIIPFLKVANDTAVAVNQGGKRKGAMCAYIETWHLDLEDFLELRKNTGDERRRTHDMNTANWIPDLFMKRVSENGTWTMFSPSDVPDLHDLYGTEFDEKYQQYEAMTETGEIKLFKKVEAMTLWRKMLSMLFETGHPWITFKDPSNLRSPQDHVGVVHSSNLCTEILLNTSADETAVCNLGSVNLPKHLDEKGELDQAKIERTVSTAIRMLDNVIDINFYPIAEAENSNLKHRPIGLGLMGFQDCLYAAKISYASTEAVDYADRSMEMISYYAILASSRLAEERGAYQTYKGSKWDRGLLPIDTLDILAKNRGEAYVDLDKSSTMDWNVVRESIKKHGMRNSNTMAIAPTATISNISGVTQSIEPAYKHLFAKSNLSGEFIVINTYLVQALKELGMWDAEMVDDLKYFDGSVLEIERIPEEIKQVYLTAFEIDPEWIIECASRRQKWIDMGQSLNLYIAEPSGKKLHEMYMSAWKKGLKTTYYLRSVAATQIEKSTTDINKRGLQPRWMKNKSASSEVTVDRVASTKEVAMPVDTYGDGDCESCQ